MFVKKKPTILLFCLFLLLFCPNLQAKTVIKAIKFNKSHDIEVTLTKKAEFKVYTLSNPNRVVLDIKKSTYDKIKQGKLPKFVKKIRHSNNKKYSRLVFDLNKKKSLRSAKIQKIKGQKYPKLIVKLSSKAAKSMILSSSKTYVKPKKTPIIVIDAGHGGKDPGTIGNYARTKEKNITLSYAKELAKQLKRTERYKVYLTRDQDEFIPLRQRVAKARRVKADLFVSLHANAAQNRDAKGFSIYTLSEKASDKEAAKLARKENRADIISGINFKNAGSDILKTLIDMSQRSSMNYSARFANIAISKVKKQGVDILDNTHRFAGFVVLTAPDMVSILIELGYLSNKSEEKALNKLHHKRKIVKGLVNAIDEYFKFKTKR